MGRKKKPSLLLLSLSLSSLLSLSRSLLKWHADRVKVNSVCVCLSVWMYVCVPLEFSKTHTSSSNRVCVSLYHYTYTFHNMPFVTIWERICVQFELRRDERESNRTQMCGTDIVVSQEFFILCFLFAHLRLSLSLSLCLSSLFIHEAKKTFASKCKYMRLVALQITDVSCKFSFQLTTYLRDLHKHTLGHRHTHLVLIYTLYLQLSLSHTFTFSLPLMCVV